MCFVFFCFCDTCNSYSTKCVELFIFIISFASFILSILAFFFIKREHLRSLCFILLIVLIIFSFIILLSISFILMFRHKKTINNTKYNSALIFSIIGLLTSIIYFICMISEISLIHSHYQDLNFPCLTIDRNDGILGINEYLIDKDLQEVCIRNRNYNTKTIKIKEFLILYGFAVSLLILMASLIYSWFNEYRRIKYLINGSLHDFSIQKDMTNKNNDDDEEDDEDCNNKDIKRKKIKIINNNEINNIHETENNNSKNINTKIILDKKYTKDGIIIFSDKTSKSISIEQSSNIILDGNFNKKIEFKNKK